MNSRILSGMRVGFALGLGLFISHTSHALVGLGAMDTALHSYQTNAQGERRWVSLDPVFLLNHQFHLSDQFSFAPEIGIVFHRGLETGYHKRTTFLVYDLLWKTSLSGISFRLGFSTFLTAVSGPGGTSERQNGSDTVTFYLPGSRSRSADGALDFGVELPLQEDLSLKAQTFWRRFAGPRRHWAALFSINYLL